MAFKKLTIINRYVVGMIIAAVATVVTLTAGSLQSMASQFPMYLGLFLFVLGFTWVLYAVITDSYSGHKIASTLTTILGILMFLCYWEIYHPAPVVTQVDDNHSCIHRNGIRTDNANNTVGLVECQDGFEFQSH